MKRAVVFAHYDKDAIIDDYVIYYIENLKKVSDIIIFVSCNDLSETEKNKLNVNHIIAEEHDEYDFGSYKRGFIYLKENNLLTDIDELIFANDSCYAPLFPFEDMFNKMENEQCDFWGVTKNHIGIEKNNEGKYRRVVKPHCQSYFLVYKNKVFESDCFFNFIINVKKENCKNDIIIKYEMGLSEALDKNGFCSASYIKEQNYHFNPSISNYYISIKKYKSPFIKCSIPRGNNDQNILNAYKWESVITKYTKYPIQHILKNIERTSVYKNSNSSLARNYITYFGSRFRLIIVSSIKYIKNIFYLKWRIFKR